jgi:hypothetical protein
MTLPYGHSFVCSDEYPYGSIIFNILHFYNVVFSNHDTDFIVCSDEYPYGNIIFNILHLYTVVFFNHDTDFIVCSDECTYGSIIKEQTMKSVS